MRFNPSLFWLLACTISSAQSLSTVPVSQSVATPCLAAPDAQTATTRRVICPPANSNASEEWPANPATGAAVNPASSTPPVRPIRPLTTRSEFELFAADAAGDTVPVYGRQLFDEAPSTFAPVDRIPVPSNYVLGPGDELLIRIWGKIELQSRVTLDRNGQVFLPKIGALTVAGLRYEQLESYLHTAVANLYKDFDLNVTMGQLRSIQIFVLGSARQPGAYTVSSLSTLVNALFTSGGPSATGSMRHIQLRRADRIIADFDIYELLRNGDKSHDVQLLPGDVIYIPAAGPQVAIIGSVNEPGVYELKGDTPIASALRNAGGLTSLASADRALLERVEDRRRRTVDEFALDPTGLQRNLRDGDILRVFPISPQFDNAVALRGNVAQPGRVLWHEGMRVSDLIPSRNTLLTRDYWNQLNYLGSATRINPKLGRQTDDNPDGRPMTYQQEPIRNIEPMGQGTADNVPPYRDRRSLDPLTRDALNREPLNREHWDQESPSATDTPRVNAMSDITQTNAEINWDYAAIERRDEHDLSTRLIAFNLGSAIDSPTSADNQVLRAGDIVTVFSRKDIPLAQDKHAAFVSVGGEVNAPGVYRINAGETLRQVVVRAGGLTAHSYLYASQLTRASTRRAQEEQLKLSAAQMQRELASRYAAAPLLTSTNNAEQQAQYSSQQAIIAQLSAARPSGRIVLDMNPASSTVGDIPDFPLEDGDSFTIPAQLSTIQVGGAVYNENAFRYQQKKRLSSYLKDAGGSTRQADVKRAFLIRADGTVVSRQSHSGPWRNGFENLSLLPGDAIIVPTKLKSPNNFMQQLPFFTQMLSQTALTGAVIGTSY